MGDDFWDDCAALVPHFVAGTFAVQLRHTSVTETVDGGTRSQLMGFELGSGWILWSCGDHN